jgi:hypothetical protein
MKPHNCPVCGYLFEVNTAVPGSASLVPSSGDISFCMSCSTMLIFDDELHLNLPTHEQQAEIEADPGLVAHLLQVKSAIQQVRSKSK